MRDLAKGVVLGAKLDASREDPEVPRDDRRQTGHKEEGRGARGLGVGNDRVHDAHAEEEHEQAREQEVFRAKRLRLLGGNPGVGVVVHLPILPGCTRHRLSMAATSGWCRSKAGRSERIRGIEVKLCRGTGHAVAHSSEPPKPQGSSTKTVRGPRWVRSKFQMNGRVESAVSTAPTVCLLYT